MSKTKTEPTDSILINLVLDSSGSMSEGNKRGSTIEGLNAFFREQRELPGEVLLSMTVFNTSFDVRFVGADLREVPDLGSAGNRYTPAGGTALYDAVVTTIRGTDEWLLNHREFTGKIVCVINTDGEENSSTTTTLDQLNELITAKTEQDWEFVFMGVGQAAWTEGAKFTSIPTGSTFYATASASGLAYESISSSLSATRSTGSAFNNSNAGEIIGANS